MTFAMGEEVLSRWMADNALALGGVLVDLAEDLVPLRYQLFDTIANLVFHYPSRSIFQHINCCSFIVSPCDSIFNSVY